MFLVPDHGDRLYVQEMTGLLLGEMGFKEIAIHQVGEMSSVFTAVLLLTSMNRNRLPLYSVQECLVPVCSTWEPSRLRYPASMKV